MSKFITKHEKSEKIQSCAKKYRKIGLYVVKWPWEKWACHSHDDATPLSFWLQVTEDFF